jgi:magnesium-transporting ATPase (P-type)
MNNKSESESTTIWHALSWKDTLSTLAVTGDGLNSTEAKTRLAKYGPNALPEPKPIRFWVVVLRQFRSPLIYILFVAALISLGIGEYNDAGFILGVLVLNAAIGSTQEWNAEQKSLALKKLLNISAVVRRNGETIEIDAVEVVPGDIVFLESGNRIPADIRLAETSGLELDESLLTGESLPVAKDPAWTGPDSAVPGDQLNMAFAGSMVSRGRGTGVVIATGESTGIGQLALEIAPTRDGKPPLLIRMERFANLMAWVIMLASVAIGTYALFSGKYTFLEVLLFTSALAVAAIPEGLPVALTVALAVATSRMAKRGVIVRRLTAVEGLGSCTFIGSDKTGTLTCNELTVREIFTSGGKQFTLTGEGFEPNGDILSGETVARIDDDPSLEKLLQAAAVCNEATLHQHEGQWVYRGDTVDVALLSMAAKGGLQQEEAQEQFPEINRIPFESERQFAASYNAAHGDTNVFVKGAPEKLLQMCTNPDAAMKTWAEKMAAKGYRILALASSKLQSVPDPDKQPDDPTGLEMLGLVAMTDPLRAGAKDAIHDCQRAGVEVVMITGDHASTALSIAREIGLASEENEVVTGSDLISMTDDEIEEVLIHARVFARVTPNQKLQLVEAAQRRGHFVAVTGDGVNDAPALQMANIGIAMGMKGTDIAREAAELVISDDDFSTIVGGIEEGRVAYNNIRKVVYFLISTGAAEIVLVGLAIVTGSPLPLLPVQMLWLNLVTSGIQDVALAFEPNEGGMLDKKPRPPKENIFDRLMIERTLLAAFVMGGASFILFGWLLPDNPTEADVAAARNQLLLLMVLFENVHLGNCRSETKSAFSISPLRSPILLCGTATALLLHTAIMYVPQGQRLLDTAPLPPQQWFMLILIALLILPILETHKWYWNRKIKRRTNPTDKQKPI